MPEKNEFPPEYISPRRPKSPQTRRIINTLDSELLQEITETEDGVIIRNFSIPRDIPEQNPSTDTISDNQ